MAGSVDVEAGEYTAAFLHDGTVVNVGTSAETVVLTPTAVRDQRSLGDEIARYQQRVASAPQTVDPLDFANEWLRREWDVRCPKRPHGSLGACTAMPPPRSPMTHPRCPASRIAAPRARTRFDAVTPPAGIVLTDGVLTLRPFTLADVQAHLEGEDDEQVRWLSGGASTPATVTAWVERNLQSWASDGPVYNFAICPVAQQPVGMIEANVRVPGLLPHAANISYGLYPRARSRGYATRAVQLMLAYLAERDGVRAAVIQVDRQNTPSVRVAERAGFRFVGRRVTPDGDLLAYVKRLATAR